MPEIPCWREIDGRWYREAGIIPSFYPGLLENLRERLVSLDEPPGDCQEWLEYRNEGTEPTRSFARIEIVFESNNSVTIDVLETRDVPGDQKVWWRYGRPV